MSVDPPLPPLRHSPAYPAVGPSVEAPARLGVTDDVSRLAGIGPAMAKRLAAINLKTLGDLINYFPRDYIYGAGRLLTRDLTAGSLAEVAGTIVATHYVPGPRARFEATLEDEGGKLALVFFNAAYLRRAITPGMKVIVKGKITFFRSIPQMQNPKWRKNDADAEGKPGQPAPDQTGLVPIYPATAGLDSARIEVIIRQCLDGLSSLPDPIAGPWTRSRRLMPLAEAYPQMHHPSSRREAAAARSRFVYDELLTMQLRLAFARRNASGRRLAPTLRCDRTVDARIRSRLPFTLTDSQERVIHDVLNDLRSGQPMNRLVQGDVGSGKTAVALYAMLVAVANRMQAVLLAPTEILAEQHHQNISSYLSGSAVSVELVTGRTRRSAGERLADGLKQGRIHIAVGTQSLLSDEVEFANLGLVVIDEQHRLGVRQRAGLRGKSASPHYLVMTATPIPRTLALSYFADYDLSVIDRLPPGRKPVFTQLLPSTRLDELYALIKSEAAKGRATFVVAPFIEDQTDEDTGKSAAGVASLAQQLAAGPLAGLRIGVLHGQHPPEHRQTVMEDLKTARLDVIVSTTIIEVGVDVPRASVMVIYEADRFGLSQLHQLRGRVGRGGDAHQSYCILISNAPGDTARQRLEAMVGTSSGFELAELDLKIRGPGEFFGTRQHGLPELKLADLSQETDLLTAARDDALALLQTDPDLLSHPALKAAVLAPDAADLQLGGVG